MPSQLLNVFMVMVRILCSLLVDFVVVAGRAAAGAGRGMTQEIMAGNTYASWREIFPAISKLFMST